MKTHNLLNTLLLFVVGVCLTLSQAQATPSVDTFNVQGYMKKANGAAVTDGTYTMAIGVFQNGTAIWAKQYAVAVSNGLFSQALTGTGSDLSGTVPVGTGMRSNFAAATLNPALLSGAASGSVMFRVYAITQIDGANPQFDISLGATPTSYIAALAQGVEAGAVTLAGIASGAKSAVGGGAGANKIPLLDASGLLDTTMIPSLPASTIGSGQVGIANGGTGSSDGSITGTGSVTYKSAAGSTTTLGDNTSTSSVVIQSGTGGISQTVTGTTGNISFTAGSASGNLTLTPGTTSGGVTIGSGTSSGNSVFGNAGGASSTTIQSGTGHILLSPAGSGVVRVTNGNGLNLVNGTGSITVNSPVNPTSWSMVLPSSAGTGNQFLMTDGFGTTSWANVPWAAPGAIGSTTPAAGTFTTLTANNGFTTATDMAVGIGTSIPTNAMLDVATTTSGLSAIIVPRDTTANRPPTGVNGMLRYNTNLASMEFFMNGGWTQPITNITVTKYTSGTGNYVPPNGLVYAIIEIQGGGGGGGGANATAGVAGSGGGAGAYIKVLCTRAQLTASNAYVVGGTANGGAAGNNAGTAGNLSSFAVSGGTLSAAGGNAGGGSGTVASTGIAGGTGGVPTIAGSCTTLVAKDGDSGGNSIGAAAAAAAVGGNGGSTLFGAGGKGRSTTTGAGLASPTANSGAGGGGGTGATASAGGAGAAGQIVITEFRSQ